MSDDAELLKLRIAALEVSLTCMTHASKDYERIARSALDDSDTWRKLYLEERAKNEQR